MGIYPFDDMAVYRQIYISFWTDPKVDDEFTPEDKYFYLYLLTNPHGNLCGCYEISLRQMERETGYNSDTITRLLTRFEKTHDVIRYDEATKEILILNWAKYNWSKSPKLVKGVESELKGVKSETFKNHISDKLKALLNGYPIDTVSIPYTYPMHTTVTVTATATDTESETVSVSDAGGIDYAARVRALMKGDK